jgi:hypothetical protein
MMDLLSRCGLCRMKIFREDVRLFYSCKELMWEGKGAFNTSKQFTKTKCYIWTKKLTSNVRLFSYKFSHKFEHNPEEMSEKRSSKPYTAWYQGSTENAHY